MIIASYLTGLSCGIGAIALVLLTCNITSAIRECGCGD